MRYQKLFISLLSLLSLHLLHATDPWKGDEYAKNSSSQEDSAFDFLGKVQWQGNETILDVGCGDGKITAALARKVPKGSVLGIDISPSMIQFAQKGFPKVANLSFVLGDAANLDYREQFDLITSFTVMQWVTKQHQALCGFEQALKSGGKLWIQLPLGLPAAMQQALTKLLADAKWEKYFISFQAPWNFFSQDQYRILLLQAHLTPTKLEVTRKDEAFPSRAAFQGFVKQWFPYLRPLPDALKELFMTELVDAYLKNLPPDEQGRVHFIVDRLDVEAVKEN